MVICLFVPMLAVACERVRRPELAGVAFALIAEDGSVQVASEFAQDRGVRAGQTLSGARALCPGLTTLAYDAAAYQAAARVLWDIVAEDFSVVEPVSPELFFVLADRTFVLSNAQSVANRLSASIGTGVKVGIAASKFAARRAAAIAEVGKPVTILPGQEFGFLGKTPIVQIPGIPAKQVQRLEKLGLRTIGDAAADASRLPKDLRQIGGRLASLSYGRDGDRVRALWPERSEEATAAFDDPTEHLPMIDRCLLRCAEKIAARLLAEHQYCRSLSLTVRVEGGAHVTHAERLVLPASDALAIHRGALRLFGRVQAGAPVTGLRLVAAEIGSGSGVQLSLLSEGGGLFPEENARRTAAAVEYIRTRWGAGSVSTAGALHIATKTALRVYPLGHLVRRRVIVEAIDGVPIQFTRRRARREGERVRIEHVQNRWREVDHFGGAPERHVFRVRTSDGAVAELHRVGDEWTLQAMAD